MCITKSSSKYYTLWQHQATKWPHTARIFNVSLPLFAFAGADVISFDGYGVIPYRFRSKKLKMLKDAITLKFRTTSRDGVLLHGEGQQGDYISLELRRARLQLNINLGRQSPCQYQLSFTTECWDFSYLPIDDCSVAQRGSIFNNNNIWRCSDTRMTEAALTRKEFVVRKDSIQSQWVDANWLFIASSVLTCRATMSSHWKISELCRDSLDAWRSRWNSSSNIMCCCAGTANQSINLGTNSG